LLYHPTLIEDEAASFPKPHRVSDVIECKGQVRHSKKL
jgi:hypothetical protein